MRITACLCRRQDLGEPGSEVGNRGGEEPGAGGRPPYNVSPRKENRWGWRSAVQMSGRLMRTGERGVGGRIRKAHPNTQCR